MEPVRGFYVVGWINQKSLYCREIDDKYVLLQCDVPMEKEFLMNDRSIFYKYVVHHEKSGKIEYEFVHRMPDYQGQIPNRSLWVPKDRLMKSAGMMYMLLICNIQIWPQHKQL